MCTVSEISIASFARGLQCNWSSDNFRFDRRVPHMTSIDDRISFESHKQEMCLALGNDASVFKLSMDTISAFDRYDYSYLWSFMGLPIIQMPADILATLEVIWEHKPDIIIETGVARGGSVIMMAAMLQLIGKGRVIGVDIDIRAHNRKSIESHPMWPRIELIEGPSTDPATVARVAAAIPAGASVMVVLDSDHSRDHVLDELRAYGDFVTENQFLIVADTLLGRVEPAQTPTKRSKIWLPGDEPLAAVNVYRTETDRFVPDEVINGKLVMSSSPGGYLRCVRGLPRAQVADSPSISLRSPTTDDFPTLAEIRRDKELQAMLLVVPENTDDEAIAAWIQRRAEDPGGVFKVIANNTDGTALGFVQVSQVHRRNRYGFGGIALLPGARGRGVGRAAMKELLKLAGRELGLEKLQLEVRADNTIALRLYLSMGFQIVGNMKDHFRAESGRRYDVLLLEKTTPLGP